MGQTVTIQGHRKLKFQSHQAVKKIQMLRETWKLLLFQVPWLKLLLIYKSPMILVLLVESR